MDPVIHSVKKNGEPYLSVWMDEDGLSFLKIDENLLPDLVDILIELQD